MSAMFKHANSFKQNLCGWIQENPKILDNVDTRLIFFDTACPEQTDPTNLHVCFNC